MAAKKDRKTQINKVIQPLSDPKAVAKEIAAETRLEFRPTALQIRGEKRASRQQSKNIKAWYGQHRQQLKGLRKGGIRLGNQLARQAAGQTATAAAQDTANRQAIMEQEQSNNNLYGTSMNYGPYATSAAAAAQRQNIAQIGANRIAQQGQANANLLGQINAAATLGRNAALTSERNLRLNADQDMRELAQKRGDFAVKTRADIIQRERDYALQRAALAGKRGYNQAMIKQAVLGYQGDLAQAGATKTQAQLGLEGDKIKAGAYGNQNGKTGDNGYTRKEVRTALAYLGAGVAKAGKGSNSVYYNPNQYINYLINRGVDTKVAKVAVNRYIKNHPAVNTGH